jgi:hypothetical protein
MNKRKTTKKTKFVLPKGLKVVSGPKNAARRKWQREKDITVSGGCRSTPIHV